MTPHPQPPNFVDEKNRPMFHEPRYKVGQVVQIPEGSKVFYISQDGRVYGETVSEKTGVIAKLDYITWAHTDYKFMGFMYRFIQDAHIDPNASPAYDNEGNVIVKRVLYGRSMYETYQRFDLFEFVLRPISPFKINDIALMKGRQTIFTKNLDGKFTEVPYELEENLRVQIVSCQYHPNVFSSGNWHYEIHVVGEPETALNHFVSISGLQPHK